MTDPDLAGLHPDPPVPADRKCVVCHQPRNTERSRRSAPGHAVNDPFCSTVCCRLWHRTLDQRAAA